MLIAGSLLISYGTYAYASPILPRQAVTALISPSQPPPSGCTGSFPSVFGIAVMNITSTSSSSTPSQTLQRRQQPPPPIFTVGMLNQISDGQVQGEMHTDSISIVTPTASTSTSVATLAPLTQVGDGQVQGLVGTTMPDTQSDVMSATTTTICSSSNVPSPFLGLASESSLPSKPPTVLEQACGISARPSPTPSTPLSFSVDASNAASSSPASSLLSSTSLNATEPTSSPSLAFTSSPFPSVSTQASSQRLSLVSCLTNSTLRLHLQGSNLYDSVNRTGYIASNYQFQFDGPPQSGAIYTSGWSICPVSSSDAKSSKSSDSSSSSTSASRPEKDDESGDIRSLDNNGIMTLALGGSTTFWQCLSGDFYNLYTENWAAQCSPVELRIVRFVDCDH